MKAVELLVRDALPGTTGDHLTGLDAKGLEKVMLAVAQDHPERFSEVSKRLADIGRTAAYLQGETVTMADFKPVVDRDKILAEMDQEIAAARILYKDDAEFRDEREKIWHRWNSLFEKSTMESAVKNRNNLGFAVSSGSRGKPAQLQAMLSTPGIYTYNGKVVPMFIRNGFNSGLRPGEYMAGTFGGRESVVATKTATAKGGYLGKLMSQAGSNVPVTVRDCEASNGIDLAADDESLKNRVLAADTAGFKTGTLVDANVLRQIKKQRIEKVIVRSPLTCQAEHGVCSKCIGAGPAGKLIPVGASVGITSANAIGEPIAQGSLNCLVEGTQVLMADYSTRSIESLVPGDKVMGADKSGRIFPTDVTAVWDQGIQPTQRRTYRMGQTKQRLVLESTSDHPILSNRKTYGLKNGRNNATLEMLKAGYSHTNLAAVLPVENLTGGEDDAWALLLGVILGDGNRWSPGSAGSPTVSCADLTQIVDLNCVLEPLNIALKKCKRSHDWRLVLRHDDLSDFRGVGGRVVCGYRNPVKLKMLEWGLTGKYAHEKRLPDCVWTWNAKSVSKLLSGFIATDGSVYQSSDGHCGVSFASTSRPMLEDLKRLMAMKLCVYSGSISKIGAAGEGNRRHSMWAFYVTRKDQVTRLANCISSVLPGVKNKKLALMMSGARYAPRNSDGFYRALRESTEDLGLRQCWDISVAHADSLFVLANGLIVSNTKHVGGQAKKQREFAGFDAINRFVESPEVFPDKAVVAETDGKVDAIRPAPQGGLYVTVGDQDHYVLPGYEVTVKVGDSVEAGQQLSEGIGDPSDVVRLRGLGEGRRYYADRFNQLLADSGMPTDRRNTELAARFSLDHVRLTATDPGDDALPDDIVPYEKARRMYVPPEDADERDPIQAQGRFLSRDALHYSIGTRVTPTVSERLKSAGIGKILTSAKAPDFEPEMVRLQQASHANTDWLASMNTNYLARQLESSATRGDTTNIESNHHFVPRLAYGVGFGDSVSDTGKF